MCLEPWPRLLFATHFELGLDQKVAYWMVLLGLLEFFPLGWFGFVQHLLK